MNLDQLEGKWDQVKGQIKEKWGKLTNDDIAVISGKKDQLLGKLRERYGYTAARASSELGTFMDGCCVQKDGSPASKSCGSSDKNAAKHRTQPGA